MNKKSKDGELNVRLMQVYSAICLWKFCQHISLKDGSIVELIKHLVGISTCHNLPDWDQRGKMLSLVGRGDPIPSEIMPKIDSVYLDDFDMLCQTCVEVGIIDMYGASTGEPKKFMEECVNILRAHHIDVPSRSFLFQFSHGSDHWGEPISDIEFASILINYGMELG